MMNIELIQFWDSSDLPEDVRGLVETTQQVNFDLAYTLFNDEQAAEFLLEAYGTDVLSLYNKSRFPAMKSDIFRVGYCYFNGGVYLDAATRCVKSFSSMPEDADLVLMRKWHGKIWNGFIASAKPANVVLGSIWEQVLANVKNQSSENVWAVSGPGVYQSIVDEHQSKVKVYDQADIKEYFDLVNELDHKGDTHWSKRQKTTSIFVDS